LTARWYRDATLLTTTKHRGSESIVQKLAADGTVSKYLDPTPDEDSSFIQAREHGIYIVALPLMTDDAFKKVAEQLHPSAAPAAVAAASTPPSGGVAAGPSILAAAPQPQNFALIIGIEKYRDLGTPVVGAHADAQNFATVMRRSLGLHDDRVRTALDDHATKTDIENQLAWLKDNVTPGSRIYFYYSGHGAPDTGSATPFLVPYDGDPKSITQTGLALSAVLKRLSETRAREVVAFVDACFSGEGGRSVLPPGARPLVRIKDTTPAPQLVLMTAAGGSEISGPAKAGDQGLFTQYLTEGVRTGQADTDGDGQISLKELSEWITPRVVRDARADGRTQHPTLTLGANVGDAGNFVIAYGIVH
jgi:hypothetical protein